MVWPHHIVMRPSFSEAAEGTMPSYIMGLVEVAERPGMISFATGLPDNSFFDTEGLRGSVDRVLSGDGACPALQYGATAGFRPLREKIAERCRSELGFEASADDVFMTNGSQECFDQLGRMFLNRGDTMAVENPGYLGALQSFSSYGPIFRAVEMTDDGPDGEMLSDSVESGAKMFYSIPNFQNPSGRSYSRSARLSVSKIIEGSGCLLVEDDAYGELGYNGRPGSTIKSMAPEDTVLLGSFSKTISPGMRVGWMVVPDWMKEVANRSIEAASLQSGSFSQRVIDDFLSNNDYEEYLSSLRRGYKHKKRIFLDAMEDRLPEAMRWNDPAGGMFIWLRSPDGTDAMKLFELALDKGLVTMPGRPFHIKGGENTVRLNFATPSAGEIEDGMKILGGVCRDLYCL